MVEHDVFISPILLPKVSDGTHGLSTVVNTVGLLPPDDVSKIQCMKLQPAPSQQTPARDDESAVVKARKPYVAPELKDLGLLRLVTKFSF